MTTIVCDRFQISADSALTDDSTISHVIKLFRCKAGIIGVAGDFGECSRFITWMRNGKTGDSPDMNGVQALAVTRRGILFYEYSHEPYQIAGKFCAIGSGAQAALAVMHYGGTTREAVQIASKIDPYTGGRIRTLKLI